MVKVGKCWRLNTYKSKGINKTHVYEFNNYPKALNKKSRTTSVWKDWENKWNAYSSKYPFEHDSKIYRGDSKTIALRKARAFIRRHDKC